MQRLILTNSGCAIKSSSSELNPMCFGCVDKQSCKFVISQTMRLSAAELQPQRCRVFMVESDHCV